MPNARQTFWLCSASSRVGDRKSASQQAWISESFSSFWVVFLCYGDVIQDIQASCGSREVVSTLCSAPKAKTHVFPALGVIKDTSTADSKVFSSML